MNKTRANELLKKGQDFFFAKPPDRERATESFRLVTECAPNWAEGFLWLGTALFDGKELHNACKNFKKAAQLDDQDARSFIWLGQCLAEMGCLADAIRNYRTGIALKPHYAEADARLMLADALEQSGKIQEAVSEWKIVSEMEGFYASGDKPMIEAKAKLAKHGIRKL